MTEQDQACPECSCALTYVEDVPLEAGSDKMRIAVRLASTIYKCPDHGLFRIFVGGAVVPYTRRVRG
jgi:hypothetical protein